MRPDQTVTFSGVNEFIGMFNNLPLRWRACEHRDRMLVRPHRNLPPQLNI